MNADGIAILAHLNTVAAERQRRLADASLNERVRAVKHYQHARFAKTYVDILAQPRFTRAAQFFLDDLYGPKDFTERDAQFARIVPGLVRLFPSEIVGTVRSLGELHALSETLDSALAAHLSSPDIKASQYVRAWQAVGQPAERERQIALMLAVGSALDRYTRNPVLRHSLRLMRGPARAAGLAALQNFLESGFDTFREMRGAAEFLATIASRERALAAALFAADPSSLETRLASSLGQLP
jgi:hypothetical protein